MFLSMAAMRHRAMRHSQAQTIARPRLASFIDVDVGRRGMRIFARPPLQPLPRRFGLDIALATLQRDFPSLMPPPTFFYHFDSALALRLAIYTRTARRR